MRRLAHVSDLHFGTEAPEVVAALTESIRAFAPHLVVATGDLTQRARAHEFESAQRFLASLGAPVLVVPGNHDIAPLWRPLERTLRPFERYRRHISPLLDHTWQDDELLVLGVSSVRSSRWKEGSLSERQRRWIQENAARARGALRILATHHPVAQHRGGQVDTALLSTLEASDVGVCLSGHLHRSFSGLIVDRLGKNRSVLAIHACTATSTRLRGQSNAYNRITISGQELRLDAMTFDSRAFSREATAVYARSNRVWQQSMLVPAATSVASPE